MKKVNIDAKKCIGCALCSDIAPKTFRLKNDGKSEVIDPKGDSDSQIIEAATLCPNKAITYKK